MGMFKWFKKDTSIVNKSQQTPEYLNKIKKCSPQTPEYSNRIKKSSSQPPENLNNQTEAHQNAIKAFAERRSVSGVPGFGFSRTTPDKNGNEILSKKENTDENTCKRDENITKGNENEADSILSGVPQVLPHEVYELGTIAGTQNLSIEVVSAEWQNSRVSLKRQKRPDHEGIILSDIAVLKEIRHPSVLLLMAMMKTPDFGIVEINEHVDSTLFTHLHDYDERLSLQDVARCAGKLADALRHALMRGFIHGAINSNCVYVVPGGNFKLGGWELAVNLNESQTKKERAIEEDLRDEVFRWLAPEVLAGYFPTESTDIYGLALLIWEMCTMQVPWSNLDQSGLTRRYASNKGINVKSYDFPGTLRSLLEKSLQVDSERRNLDMYHFYRKLRNFELQYENEELIFVRQHDNNNNHTTPITNPKYIQTPREQFVPEVTPQDRSVKLLKKERIDLVEMENNREGYMSAKSQLMYEFLKNEPLVKENFLVETSPVEPNYTSYDENEREKEESAYQSSSPSESSRSTKTVESRVEESPTDTRESIRRIREVTAKRREQFFEELAASQQNDSIEEKQPGPTELDKKFEYVKSLNYKPYKPASHNVSLEPANNKSISDYDPEYGKSTNLSYKNYKYLSTPLRLAVADPKVLDQSSSDLFDTSWSKEKQLVESKMAKYEDCKLDESKYEEFKYEESNLNNYEKVYNKLTYNATLTTDSSMDQRYLNDSNNFMNYKAYQDLQNSLDRAVGIVKSTTPSMENYPELSTSDNLYSQRGEDQTQESLFEVLNKSKQETIHLNEEVKSKLSSSDNLFFQQSEDQTQESLFEESNKLKQRTSDFNEEIKSNFSTSGNLFSQQDRSQIQESLFEEMNKSRQGTIDFNGEIKSIETNEAEDTLFADDKDEDCEDCEETPTAAERKFVNIEEDFTPSPANVSTLQEKKTSSRSKSLSPRPISWDTHPEVVKFSLSNDGEHRNCKECTRREVLIRRRSFPNALSSMVKSCAYHTRLLELKTDLDVSGDVEDPEDPVEDLYIDDEFDGYLSVNMVLHQDVEMDENGDIYPKC